MRISFHHFSTKNSTIKIDPSTTTETRNLNETPKYKQQVTTFHYEKNHTSSNFSTRTFGAAEDDRLPAN